MIKELRTKNGNKQKTNAVIAINAITACSTKAGTLEEFESDVAEIMKQFLHAYRMYDKNEVNNPESELATEINKIKIWCMNPANLGSQRLPAFDIVSSTHKEFVDSFNKEVNYVITNTIGNDGKVTSSSLTINGEEIKMDTKQQEAETIVVVPLKDAIGTNEFTENVNSTTKTMEEVNKDLQAKLVLAEERNKALEEENTKLLAKKQYETKIAEFDEKIVVAKEKLHSSKMEFQPNIFNIWSGIHKSFIHAYDVDVIINNKNKFIEEYALNQN